jgi:hypothetical protein
MRSMMFTVALAVALLAPLLAMAKQPTADLQALDDALPGNLINDPSRLDWAVFGSDAQSKAIKGTTAPGGGALQITTPRKGATLYDIGTNAPITAAIKPGQRITVAFYARTVKAETPDKKGVIGVRFQQNAAPYPGFGDAKLVIGSEWQLYEVTAVSDRAIPAGQAVVSFQLSGAKQTVEIGQTIIVEGVSSIIAKGGTTRTPTPVMLPQLEGKGSLLNNPASTDWAYYGASATHKTVPAKGMPGDSATQFTISTIGANAYESGVNVPISGAVAEGDVMIIAVLARTISAETPDGLGKLGLRVQQNSAPYPGFGEHTVAPGPNWKLFQIKTRATISIPAGKASVGLHLGGAQQTIEIGRVYVLAGATP